ncbi:unnamed protein product [Moneuplotes crassus]|uniref:Uncharacterized protein n=1 Tax=Euplotes crassus TaxID=5936 RepID=A0AAD1XSV1_EUPCR|nr:unnamed protein product [Moneuplotes crassus]
MFKFKKKKKVPKVGFRRYSNKHHVIRTNMGVIQNYSQRKIYQNYQSRNESLTTRHFNNSLNHTQLSVYSNKQLGIGHKRPSGGRYLGLTKAILRNHSLVLKRDDGDIKLNEEIKIEHPQERDKKSLPKILNKAEDKPTCQANFLTPKVMIVRKKRKLRNFKRLRQNFFKNRSRGI